jgi:hypothetical protein
MRKSISQLFGLSAVVLALFAGACSDSSPVEPLAPSAPSESLSLADDLAALENGVRPDLSARYHEKIIGPEGGFIYVDLHYLYVPRGAVRGLTKFEITLRDDFGVGVELTATSVNPQGRETGPKNNVGSRGFDEKVYLTFSYEHAYDVPLNPYKIKVVEIIDGQLIPQPTYINPFFKSATGVLKHFSDYGLAWPTRSASFSR